MKKRVLSLILCAAICLSLMPTTAFADEGAAEDVTPTTEVDAPVADPAQTAEPTATDAPTAEPTAAPTATQEETSAPEATATPQVDEAVQTVQALIDALPTVDELTNADKAEVNAAYEAAQSAYDAYEALTDEQKAQITGADVFEALFTWFNAQITTLDNDEVELIENGDLTHDFSKGNYSFANAIEVIKNNTDKSYTIKLLKDVLTYSGCWPNTSYTIDLNGHTLKSLTVGCTNANATIDVKDSTSNVGGIGTPEVTKGTVKLYAGIYDNMKHHTSLADLLSEGKSTSSTPTGTPCRKYAERRKNRCEE